MSGSDGRLVTCAACMQLHVIGTEHDCPVDTMWTPGMLAIARSFAEAMRREDVS